MKTLLILVASLALAVTSLPAQTLVLAPKPPPHASAVLTETQFAMALATLPTGLITGASTTIQSIGLFGTNVNVSGVPVAGVTDTKRATLTTAQLAALEATLTLPSGEVTANIQSLTYFRTPTGIRLNVQFTQ